MKSHTFIRTALSVAVSLAASCALAEKQTGNQLETVVVYGEKQGKSLQDTAASVAIMTAEQLESLPLFTINDVFSRTANVASQNGGSQRTDFTIRGVRSDGTTDTGGSGYTASVIVDGATLGAEALNYGGLGIWDLEQVEVFRGPQGTLQGRNTLMGAIVAKTKDPTYDTEGSLQLQVGNYNTRRYSGAIGSAIIDDTLSFRLSVDKYETDGPIDNITRNDDDSAFTDREEIRGKLLWEPTDDLYAKLTLSQVRNDVGAPYSVRDDDPFSYESLSDIQDKNLTKSEMAIIEVGYEFSEQLTLTSISAYTDDDYDRYDDYESSAIPGNFIEQHYAGRGWSQELRLNFNNETFTAVGGLYAASYDRTTDYYLENIYPTALFRGTAVSAYTSNTQINQLMGMHLSYYQGINPSLNSIEDLAGYLYDTNMPAQVAAEYLSEASQNKDNYAAFGEVTWNINSDWSITAGLRYDYEKLDRLDRTDATVSHDSTLDNTTDLFPLYPPVVVTQEYLVNTTIGGLVSSQPLTETNATYDAWLPKGVITYHWSDDISTSFLVQKGYRAGGVAQNQQTGEAIEFDPEYTWNYEFSLRSQWWDKRLTVNANIYHIDWEDQQVNVSPSGDQYDVYVDNAGKSVLQGMELEVSAFVTDNLEIFGNYGYSKTEFKDFESTNYDYAGNEFRQAPRNTATLGFNFRSGNFQATMDVNFEDKSYVDNENTRESDSRALVNGRIRYDLNQWVLSAWVTNLFDREYVTSHYQRNPVYPVAQDLVGVGAPRMFGAGVSYQF